MEVTLWGVRGSIPSPGPSTIRYGGNTSCVEVQGSGGRTVVLDAGTGIRRLGTVIRPIGGRLDLLLTHLHADHVHGLAFFEPLFASGRDLHIWGPAPTPDALRAGLARYLSPPVSALPLRDLPCRLSFHHVPGGPLEVPGFQIVADYVCHPLPTVGYRISEGSVAMCYLPDHEPALATGGRFDAPEWTSGYDLAKDAALLIHDAQYTPEEYTARRGWGHSAVPDAIALARLAGAARLVLFHHDPERDDAALDALLADAERRAAPLPCVSGREGMRFAL